MAKNTKKLSTGLVVLLCVLSLLVGLVGGFVGYAYITLPNDSDVYVSGDLQFHFLELGNANTGDCTLVKVGNTEVLIDAGSKVSSISTIKNYLDEYVVDDILEYVIVTHAHEDHYAGFATDEDSIFDLYTIGTIITFSQITSGRETKKPYPNFKRELNEAIERGATHYTALECTKGTNGAQTTYALNSSVSMTFLYQKFYEQVASNENNHSVCTLFTQGDNNFLFTGDLEKEGETSLAELNNLPQCKLYKAGHHGSKTSSHNVLLDEIRPEIVCVCCCAGNAEYTDVKENMFPTQEFVDRISKHTDKVYVTSLGYVVVKEYTTDKDGNPITLWKNEKDGEGNDKFASFNGNIIVTSNKKGVTVKCSNNDTLLKDTEWFRNNREMPDSWKNAA